MPSVVARALVVFAILGGSVVSGAPPASASSTCRALTNASARTAGGYYQANWMRGQKIVLEARAYLLGLPSSACLGQTQHAGWTMFLSSQTCGKLPVLASGALDVSVLRLPGTLLSSQTFTIPDVCPAGSQYAVGQPIGPGAMSLQVTAVTEDGPVADVSNFWIIDGRPDTACPSGRAKGDAGCGEPGGDPVNSLTGAFMYADKDFAMPVRGGSLEVWRSYDSQSTSAAAMGTGWTYGYSDALTVQAGSKVTWRTSSGASIEFAFQSGTTWKAPFGNTARLTQNANGTFTVKTEDLWSLDFTSAGVFTKATDRNGQATTIGRDGDGRVGTVTRAGRALAYGYNSGGNLTSITATGTGSGSAVTQFEYTGGRLTGVTKPDDSATVYDYDSSGRLSSIRNSASSAPQMQVAYGSDGRVTSQTDGNGNVTSWAWDATTKTSTMTDPRGGQWKDVYANSWLIKQVDPTGMETTYDWSEDGTLFRVRAPGGQENVFAYDSSGRLTARIDAFGRAEQMTYTGTFREPATQVDVADRTTTFGYDTNRNLKTVTPPIVSAKTTTTYASGTFDVASFKDPTQQTTTFGHDATTGDLTGSTSPLGNKTTTETDGFGQVASVTPPAGNASGASGNWSTDYQRDDVGRVTKVTDPRGVVATYTYDEFGQIKTEKDARNNVTTYAYDNAGHLKKVTLADDSTQEFTYDANGNVATSTDGRGHTKEFGYDAANRVTSVEASGREWTYTYDSAGRRKTTEAPSGRTVTLDYDVRSQPTKIDYSDSTPDVTIEYDSLGRRHEVVDGTGTWTYAYDDLDRPLTITHGSEEWTYTWDAAGRLKSREAPDQEPTSFTYDNDGRLTKVARDGTDLATYSYSTGDNTITRTLANGAVTVETFDRSGNLASSVEKDDDGDVTHSLTYTRDLQGNPTKVVDAADDSTVQQFDDRNRLTQICYATTDCDGATDYIRFTYDANNNVTKEVRPGGTTTRTFDDHDQLTEQSDGTDEVEFEYDDDGNRTQAGDTTYAVNAAGQVTSSEVGGVETEFEYDGAGLLVSKESGGSTTKYDYDPLSAQLVGQRGAGADREFVYGREAVAMVAGSDTDFFTTNEIGSVVAVHDNAGALQKAYEYEPFGTVRQATGSGTGSPVQYAGGLSLGSNTYRFGVRLYDATAASFTTPDPAGTTETYSYASGNPAVYTDPMGLFSITNPLQDISRLFGVAVERTVDALSGNAVVRRTLGGSRYSNGSLSSRALKQPRVVSDCISGTLGAGLVLSAAICVSHGSDGSSSLAFTPGFGGGLEAGVGYSHGTIKGIAGAGQIGGWSGEASVGIGIVGASGTVETGPSGDLVYGWSVGTQGILVDVGVSFQTKYTFVLWPRQP